MTTNNLAQFNSEITQFARSIPGKVTLLQKKIVLEALRRLVQKTPVDTGRARGNWQVTIGEPAEGKFDQTDKKGDATIAKGLAALAGLPDMQVIWISNNIDYIEELEHGHSGQAPDGMWAVTIAELRNMFKVVQ